MLLSHRVAVTPLPESTLRWGTRPLHHEYHQLFLTIIVIITYSLLARHWKGGGTVRVVGVSYLLARTSGSAHGSQSSSQRLDPLHHLDVIRVELPVTCPPASVRSSARPSLPLTLSGFPSAVLWGVWRGGRQPPSSIFTTPSPLPPDLNNARY